jgi:pimeloyl-ACP methyl ester carboxylesterase
MSIVTLESELIHYEVLGRGRPLIFLHGWVGSWRYWIPAMQALSISYRAYALDFWGFGDTPNRPEKYTIDQQAKLLSAFVEEMGIGRVVLVGHGLGALVGLDFARLFPNLVDRLVMTGLPLEQFMVSPRLRSDSMATLMDWLLGKNPAADAARLEAPKADAEAIRISLESMEMVSWLSIIMEMSTPCLFVHGLLDPVISLPPEELISRLPATTHMVVFEMSGHFPMLDETAKYNRLLADFLALPSGESPRSLQLKEEWKRRIR